MVRERTGAAEEANLRARRRQVHRGSTPTNVLEREQGLGRHPFEAQGPLALGAVTIRYRLLTHKPLKRRRRPIVIADLPGLAPERARAVDLDRRAADIGRRRREQERHGGSDLGLGAQALGWRILPDLLDQPARRLALSIH